MGLKCLPGRTVIKLEDIGLGDEIFKNAHDSGESSEEFANPQVISDKGYPDSGGGGGMIKGGMDDMPSGDNGPPSKDGETEDPGDGEDEDGGEDREANGGGEGADVVDMDDGDEVDPDKMRRKRAMSPRRSHMNFQAQKDESCKICVCSVEGKDEYCSRRPAMNVNECLRMADIMENYQQNAPFDTDSVLAYRIRRGQGGATFKNQESFKNQGLCSVVDS